MVFTATNKSHSSTYINSHHTQKQLLIHHHHSPHHHHHHHHGLYGYGGGGDGGGGGGGHCMYDGALPSLTSTLVSPCFCYCCSSSCCCCASEYSGGQFRTVTLSMLLASGLPFVFFPAAFCTGINIIIYII